MEASLARLTAGIERDEPQAHPFAFLTFWDSPRLQRKAAEIWVAETCPPDASLGAIAPRPPHGKIRVGYFSGDFRDHPTARLLSELIETHDRNRFEVIAFSFGPNTQDDSRKRLERAFDRFLDVRAESNVDIAALARTLNVDIAVDLCGYIHGSRPQIFALRAAPLQVSYLGFPGTMGARYMDYLVADATVITPGSEQHYVEKIIYLPNSYQVNDTQRLIADGTPSREALDLPAEGFVYCCFNNNYKLVPATFAGWMRILSQVPGSVLWLLEDNAAAADSLRHSALQAGVRPERLVFGKRISPEDHLARHRRADLFLDTLPYNAHTTASDALWVNLPVLTLAGESFAARVAASLLKAVDLPELIATTQAEYEAMAIELGSNPERLADIKKKLAAHRLAKPLFDSRLFARHLETAFSVIHERHRAGLAPDHLHVPSG
jgi:predicted O-linked N-acetylglucosamine transferase (SPINDLY family)